jgi:hypothetical protein
MKKILTLLLLFCFLISCERKEPNFSEEMIEKLADFGNREDGIVVPSPYSFLNLYIRLNENEIFITNQEYLYHSYKRYYSTKYKTFKEFLETVLNKDYVFDKSNPKIMLARYFKLDQKIEKEYAQLGFEKFLKKYSEPSYNKKQLVLKTSIIKPEEYLTISYVLYLNRYDISFDDIQVRYSIVKRKDTFK